MKKCPCDENVVILRVNHRVLVIAALAITVSDSYYYKLITDYNDVIDRFALTSTIFEKRLMYIYKP